MAVKAGLVYAKKGLSFVLDLVEIWIPMIAFVVMLGAFLVQIFYRYALNNPLIWPYEVTVLGYLWVSVLGGAYARRCGAHVSFASIYEKLSQSKQAMNRIASNGIILLAFVLAFRPAYEYVEFMRIQKSTVLRLPYNLVYSPFMVFMVLIIGRCLWDIMSDLALLLRRDRR